MYFSLPSKPLPFPFKFSTIASYFLRVMLLILSWGRERPILFFLTAVKEFWMEMDFSLWVGWWVLSWGWGRGLCCRSWGWSCCALMMLHWLAFSKAATTSGSFLRTLHFCAEIKGYGCLADTHQRRMICAERSSALWCCHLHPSSHLLPFSPSSPPSPASLLSLPWQAKPLFILFWGSVGN